MDHWPSAVECDRLLGDEEVPADVVAHVKTVAALAVDVAATIRAHGHAIDEALVEAGALLHDVGRSKTHGVDHASVGAEILRQRGLPDELVRIVERHTGGGIGPEEAARLGLPVKDYRPVTIEEKVVCACDNLVHGSKRQRIEAELEDLRDKGLHEAAAKVLALHAEVSDLAGRDLDAWTT